VTQYKHQLAAAWIPAAQQYLQMKYSSGEGESRSVIGCLFRDFAKYIYFFGENSVSAISIASTYTSFDNMGK